MKFLFDLLPVILFFATFKVSEGRKEATAELLGNIFGAVGLAGAHAQHRAGARGPHEDRKGDGHPSPDVTRTVMPHAPTSESNRLKPRLALHQAALLL